MRTRGLLFCLSGKYVPTTQYVCYNLSKHVYFRQVKLDSSVSLKKVKYKKKRKLKTVLSGNLRYEH